MTTPSAQPAAAGPATQAPAQEPARAGQPARTAVPALQAPLSDAPRLVGVDVARGLAVLGMFVAHTYATRAPHWSDPGSWIGIAYGPSSVLFATLAGVSLGLLTGRDHPPRGEALLQARLVVFTRAVLLFVLGGLLQLLVVNVAVILEQYAVLLVVCLPLLRWSPRWLLVLAALLAAVVNPAFHLLIEPWVRAATGGGGALGSLAVTGNYPVVLWSAFVVTGLAVGRMDLTATRVKLRVLAGGAAAVAVGYGVLPQVARRVGTGTYEYQQTPFEDAAASGASVAWQRLVPPVGNLLWPEPHSGTPAEVVGSCGLALAVVAVLLVVGQRLRVLLLPLASLGSMPLTAYCAQLVALAHVGFTMDRPDRGLAPLLWFVSVSLVGASAWSLLLGRGPLERVVSGVCRWAVGTSARRATRGVRVLAAEQSGSRQVH